MLFTLNPIGAFASTSPIYGDANGDHKVNVCDIVTVYREILGLQPFSPGADANRNGEVSIGDVAVINKMILGNAPIYGDANGDFIVDEWDVDYLTKVLLGLRPPTPGCDSNHDGKVSIGDLAVLQKMID